jgi:glucose-6-phosphate 1-dehydrogenase
MRTTLVIFGITGDLSRRKLLPALSELAAVNDELSIVGVSRRAGGLDELLADQPNLLPITRLFTMDLAEAGEYKRLKEYLAPEPDEQLLFYLSVPPSAAADIVDFLGQAGLNAPNVKLLFEKPFGFDAATAREFISRTAHYFDDDNIYRIDHYMAKEVASELMSLRLTAETRHHEWNNEKVLSVDIIASETLDVRDRAMFYEQTGALRDVIQGHLMQLLALVLMDIMDGQDSLPQARLAALTALQPADPREAVRAQYTTYQTDVANPGSVTETFASVELKSHDERWRGVPLRLTTGKKLDGKRTAIVVRYHDGTEHVFEEERVRPIDKRLPDAYERVLQAAIDGQKDIFTTGDEIIRSWEILAPVQEAWLLTADIETYADGESVTSILAKHHI